MRQKAKQPRLRRSEHVQRRDIRVMRLQLEAWRKNPERLMDVVKEDVKLVGVREENAEGKSELELASGRWLAMATPGGKKPKEKEDLV